MTASRHDDLNDSSTIVVELSLNSVDTAERVRLLIGRLSGIETISSGARQAHVRITDDIVDVEPGVPVLVLGDGLDAMRALQAGATGVLSPHVDGESLGAAIRAAAQGLTTLSAELRDDLVERFRANDGLEGELEDAVLTPRERQVLQLLAEGASNKSIARHLDITPHTAKFHVASIVAKLGASGRTDAVAKAMRLGLVMI